MADEPGLNDQTLALQWEEVFSAAVDLLEGCESEWDTANVALRNQYTNQAIVSLSSSSTSPVYCQY